MTIRNDHGKSSNCPGLGRNQRIVCNFLINEVKTRCKKGDTFSGRSLFSRQSGKWNTPALQLLIDAYGDSADRQLGRLLWKVLREDSEMYDFKPIYRGTEYTWL